MPWLTTPSGRRIWAPGPATAATDQNQPAAARPMSLPDSGDLGLPGPQFGGGGITAPSLGGWTGAPPATIPSTMALASLVKRNRDQAPAGPMVFNGPNQASQGGAPAGGGPQVFNGDQQEHRADPAASPIRDDVIRSLGGRGQVPSIQQFLASMPQTMTMQFGAGSGQLASPLGIGEGGRGPSMGGYTPAFQGPEQRSDHTGAAMQAYQGLLGAMTHGPESPSQAAARDAETRGRWGAGGTAQREAEDRRGRLEYDRYLHLYQDSPAARRKAYESWLLTQPGATPATAAAAADAALQSGFFQGPSVAPPTFSWERPTGNAPPAGAPTASPVGGPPQTPAAGGAQAGVPQAQTPGGAAANPFEEARTRSGLPNTPWRDIESTLEEVMGPRQTVANGVATPTAPRLGIGEALTALDRRAPGFVQRNMPAIQAYLRDRYGDDAFRDASRGTQTMLGLHYQPFTPGQMAASVIPPVLLWNAGRRMLDLFGSLGRGGQMSDEQSGRAALENYLRSSRQ